MLKLEPRPEPSRAMSIASPLIALAITVVIGTILFVILGKDPLRGLAVFFVEPVKSVYALSELAVKATPLLLIALGLAVSFRSNVWNIGAEGQYIVGAIAASGVAMLAGKDTGNWFFLPVLAGGVLGGMLWAAIVALLRDRFNANEILVSLMLVYVAEQLLNYFVYGPWKDPHGYNFPQTITFLKSTQVPRLYGSYRVNIGALGALVAAAAFWILLFRTYAGFQLQVGGLAPAAARYAGFSSRKALWSALLLSGAMAGLAGGLEVSGPLGQLTPHVPAGYGFAAIIVAFVGRLHPVGIIFSAILMSMFYIGGELAQSRLGLPQVAHRRVPGPAALHAARLRHADRTTASAGSRRVAAPASRGQPDGLSSRSSSPPRSTRAPCSRSPRSACSSTSAPASSTSAPKGLMLVAAIAGFATAFHTGNDWLAFGAGALAGALLAAAFGVLVIWLNTNQYATGLALSLFGAGFSAFVGIRYTQEKLGEQHNFSIPGLADLPFVGPAFFRQHPMVYLAIALTIAIAWFLYRSRAGLVLRAVGESPESAHALGYPVRRIRLAAVVVGGALCGVAGAYISVVYTPSLGRGHDRRQGLDRARAHHLRDLAAGARPARRLPVRRRDHAAAPAAGRRRAAAEPVPDDASVSGDHPRPRPHLAQRVVHPRQHAGVDRQAVLPRIIAASPPGGVAHDTH